MHIEKVTSTAMTTRAQIFLATVPLAHNQRAFHCFEVVCNLSFLKVSVRDSSNSSASRSLFFCILIFSLDMRTYSSAFRTSRSTLHTSSYPFRASSSASHRFFLASWISSSNISLVLRYSSFLTSDMWASSATLTEYHLLVSTRLSQSGSVSSALRSSHSSSALQILATFSNVRFSSLILQSSSLCLRTSASVTLRCFISSIVVMDNQKERSLDDAV